MIASDKNSDPAFIGKNVIANRKQLKCSMNSRTRVAYLHSHRSIRVSVLELTMSSIKLDLGKVT